MTDKQFKEAVNDWIDRDLEQLEYIRRIERSAFVVKLVDWAMAGSAGLLACFILYALVKAL